jgi:hypothetical protein
MLNVGLKVVNGMNGFHGRFSFWQDGQYQRFRRSLPNVCDFQPAASCCRSQPAMVSPLEVMYCE